MADKNFTRFEEEFSGLSNGLDKKKYVVYH